jgi:hypothetical protein
LPFAGDIPHGRYQLPRRSGEAHILHTNAPLSYSPVFAVMGLLYPIAVVILLRGTWRAAGGEA